MGRVYRPAHEPQRWQPLDIVDPDAAAGTPLDAVYVTNGPHPRRTSRSRWHVHVGNDTQFVWSLRVAQRAVEAAYAVPIKWHRDAARYPATWRPTRADK